MSNNFNFENAKNAMFESMKSAFASNFSLKNVDECINSVEAATEKFNDFLAEVNDKAEELETAKVECSKAQEFFSQKKETLNGLNKLIISLNERPEYLETAMEKAEEEFAEAENALTASETKVRNLEKFFSDLKPVEQVVANKVETPKLEVKKDAALEDKSAKIQFADGGKYRVILSNGKELDCSISDKMNKYLDGIDTQKFYGTFSIKYDKNRFKDAKQEWFLCSVSSNN